MKFTTSKFRVLILVLFYVLSVNTGFAKDPIIGEDKKIEKINDGPYIFIEKDKLNVKWVKNHKLRSKSLELGNTTFLDQKFGIHLNLISNLSQKIYYKHTYKNVEKIIAISDIHGQYDLAIKLLQNNKVIDKNNNWMFGEGHLVVLGDIFDRGDKVTEMLWLVYNLEQQAINKGGRVHFLIGNHELMILHKDIRFVNKKYITSSEIIGLQYDELFAQNTVFGSWLNSKPVLITINDIIFTHAGISPKVLNYGYSKKDLNQLYINYIYTNSMLNIFTDSTLSFFDGKEGLLWYRGYHESDFTEEELTKILNYFKRSHIVVGHTSLSNVTSLFNGKIICIDSNIKMGDYGEVLVIENNEFYRGTVFGNKIKLEN